jgi:UDP-N-acetyl-D-galactosamine dehydrogenase
MRLENSKIAIIGLGYVGLPLAVEFAKKYPTFGFDVSTKRVDELNQCQDFTFEVETEDLKKVLTQSINELNKVKNGLFITNAISSISECNVYIVTVPTPIDEHKRPDLKPLISASNTIGGILKKGDLVIYESTTYPGCTEDDCIPILEEVSGLTFNKDFFCGYSPERINPGDKVNTLTKIVKVTSGSNTEAGEFVDNLYKSIISAGTHLAPNIRVAEASKAIENAQRDMNISFVNELSLIFDRLGIDTNNVLEAAATKWNFLKYKPGLVGGHCISVDPYYLAHKAEQVGYYPAVLLSGRRVNDGMGAFVANKLIKIMIGKGLPIKNAKILILGITFKENCPDFRNTRIVDIRRELLEFGCQVEILDPWASAEEVKHEYGFEIHTDMSISLSIYSGIILGVAHAEFKDLNLAASQEQAIYDVKGILSLDKVDGRL